MKTTLILLRLAVYLHSQFSFQKKYQRWLQKDISNELVRTKKI